jgi:hypothetical protein
VPAIFGPELRGLARRQQDSGDITDYHVTPYDIGYGRHRPV